VTRTASGTKQTPTNVLLLMRDCDPQGKVAERDDASSHFSEVALSEGVLHRLHLRPIDAFGAGVIACRQEFAFDRFRQLDRSSRGADRRWPTSPDLCRTRNSRGLSPPWPDRAHF